MFGFLAFGCKVPTPSLSLAPDGIDAPATVQRDDLDAFVAGILAAAEARDFETLQAFMDEDIWDEPLADRPLIEVLRSNPSRYLGKLVGLLRGECAFAETRESWICPASLLAPEKFPYADSERVEIDRIDGQWHWTAFVAYDSPPSTIPAVNAPPSASRVVDLPEPDHKPAPRDEDPIRAVVRDHVPEVRACYNRGRERHASLAGRVVLEFTIGPDGSVTRASISVSDLPDESVGACIVAAALKWRFPRPSGGKTIFVTYPFNLSPG